MNKSVGIAIIKEKFMEIRMRQSRLLGFASCLVLLLVVLGKTSVRRACAQSQTPPSNSAKLESITLNSKNVPRSVGVHVLLPPNADAASEPLPLMLWLHGGGGDDSSYLERVLQPLVEQAWEQNELQPMVIAVPSGRRSFYMDFKDGKEKWETFLMQEMLPALRAKYKVSDQRSQTYIGGYSMGGMGSLRLAFKYPDTFSLVAAIAPAIEPSYRFEDIELRDRTYRSDAIYERIFGRPVDTTYWANNHPATLARDHASRLRESQLNIYFEVGDEDELGLNRGAEFLHDTLLQKEVPHEYRLIHGVRHGGESIPNRLADALRYVGRASGGVQPKLDPELTHTIKTYVTMFNAGNAAAIANDIYLAPVLQIHPSTNEHWILKTPEDVQSHIEQTIADIKSQGWNRSVIDQLNIRMSGPDMAIVGLTFSRLKKNGDPIPPAKRLANYVFLRNPSGWRVIMASKQPAAEIADANQIETVLQQKMVRYVDLLNGENPAQNVADEIYQFPRLSRSFLGAREHKGLLSKPDVLASLSGYLKMMKANGMTEITVNSTRVYPASEKLAFVELISSRVRADGSPIPPAQSPFTYIWVKKPGGWRMIATLAQGSHLDNP